MRTLRLIQHILLIVAVALYGIAPAGAHALHGQGGALSEKWAAQGAHEHCADSASRSHASHLSDNLQQGSGSPHVPDCCQGSACAQGCLALTFLITGAESRDLVLVPTAERFTGWRVTLTSLPVPPDLRPPIA